MNLTNTYHDTEILGIYRNAKNLNLLFENSMMVLENIEYWEFSPFSEQNIIFKLNHFSIDDVPSYLMEEYPWLLNYCSDKTLKVLEIDSSVGLHGVAVFLDMKIEPFAYGIGEFGVKNAT